METCFTASQSITLGVTEQPIPIRHYLRQPDRLVQTLAASSQIESLGNDRFRLTLRSLTFMMLEIQPIVELEVWSEADGTVQIRSQHCDLRGIDALKHQFRFTLVGTLSPKTQGQTTVLTGEAHLNIRVNVPPSLRFTPKPILEATGNSILKGILATIKHRLMQHLLADYHQWATQQQGLVGAGSPTFSPVSRPIA